MVSITSTERKPLTLAELEVRLEAFGIEPQISCAKQDGKWHARVELLCNMGGMVGVQPVTGVGTGATAETAIAHAIVAMAREIEAKRAVTQKAMGL